MKYIKLFENFQPSFYAGYLDGVDKSYPCVINLSTKERIESMVDSGITFFVMEELDAFPEALLLVYGDPDEYSSEGQSYMRGITNEFAQQIISISNSDIYTNEPKNTEDEANKDRQAFSLSGYDYGDDYEDMMFGDDEEGSAGYRALCVIPNIELNMVYKSVGENDMGYFEPPYVAIPLSELLGDY